MAGRLGSLHTEMAVLHFRVISSRHLTLRTCLEYLGKGMDLLYVSSFLASLINEDRVALEHALSQNSKLVRSGLVSIFPGLDDIFGKIHILEGLADSLFSNQDLFSMFEDNFIESGRSKLVESNYPHHAGDISLLDNYLVQSLSVKRVGVNVLIYGHPGSGKTEFVRMLSTKMGRKLYQISTSRKDGEPVRKNERFRSFRLSQHILANSEGNPLILFDEVEDVFQLGDDQEDKKFGNRSGIKGWINKLLEENPVPAFWLTNNLQCLDKAFVRRFDYVIEIKTPPRSVRSKILDQYLAGSRSVSPGNLLWPTA